MLKPMTNVGDVVALGKLLPQFLPAEDVELMLVAKDKDMATVEVSFLGIRLGTVTTKVELLSGEKA